MDTLKNVVLHLADPWLMLAAAAAHVPQTVAGLVSSGDARALLSPRAFSDALFGHFWATIGPGAKRVAEARVVPLLEGRVHAAAVEVGAGSGMWADVLARGRRVTAVYGVEPNPACAAKLRRRVRGRAAWHRGRRRGARHPPRQRRLRRQRAEPVQRAGPGGLRRVPVRAAKPGGRLYVYEHVKATRGGLLLGLYQRLVDIPWPFFVGSCRVCRPTDKMLRAAGPWQDVDLAQPPDEPPYQVLPHVLGTLTK